MLAKLRVPAGILAGLALAPFENKHLFGEDASDGTKYMNTSLLGLVGGLAAAPKGPLTGPAAALSTWAAKMPVMFVGDNINKFTRAQQPIAETNLETARLARETAQLMQQQAGKLRPMDLALLGLAGTAAGGLGYKIWQDRKPKKTPARVKVTLPTKQVGDVETSVDMPLDPVSLSEKLYQQLKRDTRRRLRSETEERTQTRKPSKKETTKAARIQNLIRLAETL